MVNTYAPSTESASYSFTVVHIRSRLAVRELEGHRGLCGDEMMRLGQTYRDRVHDPAWGDFSVAMQCLMVDSKPGGEISMKP